MNNSKAPKIVIAVGLVSVYAAAFSYAMLRDKPEINVAQNATAAPGAEVFAAPAPLPELDSALADTSIGMEPAAAMTADSATESSEVEEPNATSELASVGDKPTSSADVISPSGQARVVSSGNDSQITADVRAQIEAVAPTGSIDVSTNDGVVELTGSVPSEDEADRVWLAARNVPDVREVDVSALMISN